MRKEVADVVKSIDITIVESVEHATELMEKASEKHYSCIVTGKLSKTGDSKYYAVCTFKRTLTVEEKTLLARLYLETVILHSAIRERLIDKTVAGTNSKKSKGTF